MTKGKSKEEILKEIYRRGRRSGDFLSAIVEIFKENEIDFEDGSKVIKNDKDLMKILERDSIKNRLLKQ